MSLIDEALKRAQAAQGGAARPEAGSRPWTPVPLPDRSRIRRRKILRATTLAAIALLAAAGALFLLRRAPEKAPPLPAGEGRGEGRPSSGKARTLPPLPTPPKPTRAPRGTGAGPLASAGSSSSSSAPASAAAPSPAASDRPTALVNGKTYVGPVMLPGGGRLDLGGIAYSESNATVLLNGKIVGAGAVLEGFTISRIEENRIELQGNGVTIFLAVR